MPFSTLHYRTNPDYWRTWFPADFITESFPGQYRNWFYSLLVMSTVLENRLPFKTILGHGTVRGEDGRPMHKSLGNAIDFNDAAERAGADVMRWIFCLQNPAANVNFGWKPADETKRRLLKLWDSYRFFVLYAAAEQWRPDSTAPAVSERSELDRWLLSRLNTLVQTVGDRLDDFDAMTASRAIEDFFDDLSNWYIRRSRTRFWAPGSTADAAAMSTLHDALVTLTGLLAPFMPFLGVACAVSGPRELDDRRAVLGAVHPGPVGLQERLDLAEIQCPPPATAFSLVIAWGTPPAREPGCACSNRCPPSAWLAARPFASYPNGPVRCCARS